MECRRERVDSRDLPGSPVTDNQNAGEMLVRTHRWLTCFLISAVLLPNAVAGQTLQLESGLKVAEYRNLMVAVAPLPVDAGRIGLSQDSVQARIEFRLLGAGLVPTAGAFFRTDRELRLLVVINVVGSAYSIELSAVRPVLYDVGETAPLRALAKTWQRVGLGTHGGNPQRVIRSLDEILDVFLADYLRENSAPQAIGPTAGPFLSSAASPLDAVEPACDPNRSHSREGVNPFWTLRLISAAIEQNHDADGIVWPRSIAPFDAVVTVTNTSQPEMVEAGERLYSGRSSQKGRWSVGADARSDRPS
jgi:hypothetical protein